MKVIGRIEGETKKRKRNYRMNVQELFRKADVERVFYGYIMLENVFDETASISLEEQTEEYIKLKEYITDTCEQFRNCETIVNDNPKTLFVIELHSTTYGESYRISLDVSVLYDRDVLDAVDKDFSVWNEEGKVRLEHYGIDFISVSELAGYTIATESVNHVGINMCCATILQGLLFWGYTEESREKRFKEVEESLAAGLKDVAEGRVSSCEEVFEELERKCCSEMTDDEKEYSRLKNEFDNAVEGIEHRYSTRIIQEDHKAFIDAVRFEFRNRK